MLGRFGRRLRLTVALLSSLGLSVLASGWGTLDSLQIFAPGGVPAGTTILGCVTGGDVPMSWNSSSTFVGPVPLPGMLPIPPMPGQAGAGSSDPVPFSIPTVEGMQGTIVTIHAGDADGCSATALVLIY